MWWQNNKNCLRCRLRKALSLVELLIVVSILGILALLSASNYQEALVRARMSRVKAEFAIYATAIEAYATDLNDYPRMAHYRFYHDPAFDTFEGVPVNGVISRALTTPVAYLTSVNRFDPFMVSALAAPLDERFYTYQVLPEYVAKLPRSSFWPKAVEFYGRWRLVSVGPDLVFDHQFANSAQLPYDPTNGTWSLGNIFRSPRYLGQSCPPVPDLLGPH